MRCDSVAPYLAGLAGDEIEGRKRAMLLEHVASCEGCRDLAARHERVRAALSRIGAVEVEPPPFLLDSVLEGTRRRDRARMLPVPPALAQDLLRILHENREAIVSAAGAALIAAGTAYAFWKALRGARGRSAAVRQPA
ncbi:MAG: hypothetical protein HY775_07320 [Acidobacteria bacterium]|nr:hypothetical protein [Acidobacteriota bacterium]